MEKIQNHLLTLKQYKFEIVAIGVAVITMIVSGSIFIATVLKDTSQKPETENSYFKTQPTSSLDSIESIVVDITGSVQMPDSYTLKQYSRLKDLLKLAGGLSAKADKEFFYRNYNLAKRLKDQEKIYIPSVKEVADGLISITPPQEEYQDESEGKVSINTASLDLLDSLPSIGVTTAQKIIDNRVYESIEDLINKKVVGAATFEKIKELVEL